MKIFFIIKSLKNSGGMERVTTVVANALAQRNYKVSIVCLQTGTPYFTVDQKVSIHYIRTKFGKKKALQKLYATEKPDITIFLGSHRSLLNIPASKGITSITWEHFNATINWHPLHTLSRRLAVKHCNKIITLTQEDADNYRTLFGATNVRCIANPVTLDRLSNSPTKEKILLAVGRLASQKGFDLLLDAWHKTTSKNHGWKLRIIGNGSHKKRLLKQISQLQLADSVELLPATKDIAQHYAQASAFVMSSRFEGLPLVLIEAMNAGLPIVSFDCQTGPRDIIEHNKSGLLVEPLNTELLAQAIDELLLDDIKRQQFSDYSLNAVQKFSVNTIIDQWEQVLHEIVD